jgi:predicted DNA-binding transcriptional regulator YafY
MRLSRLINTLKPFVKPRSFSLDNHLGLAWNIAPGEERYRVRIRFDAHVSSLISETYWHKTQVLTPLEDGGLLFESTVDGLNEIVWWVLSFGSHARVEEPRELREMVMGEAKALAS